MAFPSAPRLTHLLEASKLKRCSQPPPPKRQQPRQHRWSLLPRPARKSMEATPTVVITATAAPPQECAAAALPPRRTSLDSARVAQLHTPAEPIPQRLLESLPPYPSLGRAQTGRASESADGAQAQAAEREVRVSEPSNTPPSALGLQVAQHENPATKDPAAPGADPNPHAPAEEATSLDASTEPPAAAATHAPGESTPRVDAPSTPDLPGDAAAHGNAATPPSDNTTTLAPTTQPAESLSNGPSTADLLTRLALRLKTLDYLRRAAHGDEQYVYSVRFRPEDYRSAVSEPVLVIWHENSAKVAGALSQTLSLVTLTEMEERIAELAAEMAPLPPSLLSRRAAEAEARTAADIDIGTSVCELLDVLYDVYYKLFVTADKGVAGEHALAIDGIDTMLRKFVKCVAKDLAFVARGVCRNEMREWDRILFDSSVDWVGLAAQLQERAERIATGGEDTPGTAPASPGGGTDVTMLGPATFSDERPKRRWRPFRRTGAAQSGLVARMCQNLGRHDA